MNKIICIGNRLRSEDTFGPDIYDLLDGQGPFDEVDLVDGGLRGLDLLPLVEGAGRVIFVDAVTGFGPPGQMVVLAPNRVAALAGDEFGHDAGLPYLLKVLPDAVENPPDEIWVLGVEPPRPASLEPVADFALRLARNGFPGSDKS